MQKLETVYFLAGSEPTRQYADDGFEDIPAGIEAVQVHEDGILDGMLYAHHPSEPLDVLADVLDGWDGFVTIDRAEFLHLIKAMGQLRDADANKIVPVPHKVCYLLTAEEVEKAETVESAYNFNADSDDRKVVFLPDDKEIKHSEWDTQERIILDRPKDDYPDMARP